MASKEQSINRTEREGRGERMGEGFMKTQHHFPVKRSISVIRQLRRLVGKNKKRKSSPISLLGCTLPKAKAIPGC